MDWTKIKEAIRGFLDSLKNPVTVDQYMGLLRQMLPAVGGFLVSLGVLPPDFVGKTTSTVLTLAGPVMILIGAIWSLKANNKTSIIRSAAKMPETRVEDGKIIINDPQLAAAAHKEANL